jgi:hypothetical protein
VLGEIYTSGEMAILGAKIASLSLLTLVTLFVGLMPIKLYDYIKRREENAARKSKYCTAEYVVSLVLCLGGGVLIATAFLHMLPEARVNMAFGLGQQEEVHEHHETSVTPLDAGTTRSGRDHHHDGHDHHGHEHDHGVEDAHVHAQAIEFGQDHSNPAVRRRILEPDETSTAGPQGTTVLIFLSKFSWSRVQKPANRWLQTGCKPWHNKSKINRMSE